MAKKYLSIEEAAAQLGIDTAELNRLREAGEIRGFADRGTWKFKPEDVEELGRRRQADSHPSVPILDEETGDALLVDEEEGSSIVLGDAGEEASVLVDEEDDLGRQATLVKKEDDILAGAASDSDVRLVLDESLTADSDPDVPIPSGGDSDSDVRLAGEVPSDRDSDSDVRLTGEPLSERDSDSDVKLVGDASDSDVKIIEEEQPSGTVALTSDSDSDVKLVGSSDSDVLLEASVSEPSSDSDVKLIGDDVGTDADIPLAPLEEAAAESGPSVLAESGIALETPDSGISLQNPVDSGIALEGAVDSGISLLEEDSGISLAAEEDSGISLGSPADSGIALDATDSSGSSVVLSDDLDETQLEIGGVEDDSEFELKSDEMEATGSDTGVIVFDDEDADEYGATMLKQSGEVEEELVAGSEEFEFDDDLEVVDEIEGEDDELDDMEFYGTTDEDFAESFETGESHAEFIAPGPTGVAAVPVQQEWGVATFLGLFLSTALMVLCAVVMFDFIRSLWSFNEPTTFTGLMMEKLGGLFKK